MVAKHLQPPWERTLCERCSGTIFSRSWKDACAALLTSGPELPGIADVVFNVFVSIAVLIARGSGAALRARVTGIPPKPETGELPVFLREGFRYPTAPLIVCGALGAVITVVLTRPFAPSLAIAAAVFGAWFAVRRLRSWRIWTRDFMGEVHRIHEMRILDDVVTGRLGLPTSEQRILDFGAGTGKTTEHLLKQHGVGHIKAIDIKAHPPHVEAYDGDTIPFDAQSFDLAVCLYVFHHIERTRALLQQLHRTSRYALIFEDLVEETQHPLLSRFFFGAHFLMFQQAWPPPGLPMLRSPTSPPCGMSLCTALPHAFGQNAQGVAGSSEAGRLHACRGV
jgi:SAM-dependent methyltransferase